MLVKTGKSVLRIDVVQNIGSQGTGTLVHSFGSMNLSL